VSENTSPHCEVKDGAAGHSSLQSATHNREIDEVVGSTANESAEARCELMHAGQL